MRICITSTGPNLDFSIDPRFGRCQYFLLLDEKGNLKESLANSGMGAMRGAGIAASQQIVNKGAEILITGNIGPNAFGALMAGKVKVFLASPGMSAKEVFKAWKENKLSQVEGPSVPGHFGVGPPPGRGGPGGRGRGGPGGQSGPRNR